MTNLFKHITFWYRPSSIDSILNFFFKRFLLGRCGWEIEIFLSDWFFRFKGRKNREFRGLFTLIAIVIMLGRYSWENLHMERKRISVLFWSNHYYQWWWLNKKKKLYWHFDTTISLSQNSNNVVIYIVIIIIIISSNDHIIPTKKEIGGYIKKKNTIIHHKSASPSTH